MAQAIDPLRHTKKYMSNTSRDIRVSIVRSDWREVAVEQYVTNSRRNTKQLGMSALKSFYLALAALESEEVTDAEKLEVGIECVTQLRAQIETIAMAYQLQGLDLPIMAPGTSRPKSQQKAKTMKTPRLDDEEFLEEPPMTPLAAPLEFNMDN
jgi:hypothetical protein